MALNEQTIPIDFGGGVDTKTDPKLVMPGKYLSVQNGVFTSPKRVTKRNGYTAITNATTTGTLVSPKLVRAFKEELVCADTGQFYGYSPSQSRWIPRGTYVSCEVSRDSIDQTVPSTGYVDSALLGSYLTSVWSGYSNSPRSDNLNVVTTSVYFRVVDTQTGTPLNVNGSNDLFDQTTISGGPVVVRCVLLGGTTFGIFYFNNATGFFVVRTLSFPGDGTVTASAEVNIFAPTTINFTSYDVTATASGAVFVAYNSATTIKTFLLNTAGATTASTTTTVTNLGTIINKQPIFVSASANNGYFWIYFTRFTSSTINYFILDSALASVLTSTVIYTSPALTGASSTYSLNIISVDASSTSQKVYYGYTTTPTSPANAAYTSIDSNGINQTTVATVTTTGTVTTGSTYFHVVPYSREVTYSGKQYAVFLYVGGPIVKVTATSPVLPSFQATFFLLDLSTFDVISRFAYGLENITMYVHYQESYNFGIAYTPPLILSGNKLIFPCASIVQELPLGAASLGSNYDPFAGIAGSIHYYFDFNSPNLYTSAITNDTLILGGGVMKMYDGDTCVELGFHVAPEINTIVGGSGGNIPAGTYSYLAIFQWTDNQGNQHQSLPSEATQVIIGGPNSKVDLIILSPVLTNKTRVNVAIYRTENNGTVYYEITSPIKLTTFDNNGFIQFQDTITDAVLATHLQAYTYPSSSVLENDPPPPSTIMVAHNNRLWFVDSESPNNIWYTKTGQPLIGVSPSGFLTVQLDSKYGDIAALAEMDDKLIIFKSIGLFVMSGDGANDTGTNSSLSSPQLVPSDVGCISFKSCITTPVGVMFQSANGIYIVSRSLGVQYLGMDVESFNTQTFIAATMIEGKSQIRFLTASGTTLVYDYIFNKWGEFTNHTGVSSDIWNETYVYVASSGRILQETQGLYTDNGTDFALAVKTGWLAMGSVQGFQRVRRFITLGDYANGTSASHGVQVQVAYDFNPSYSTPISYLFGASSSSGKFQYRERLPQQKCDSISLLITEVITGDPAEYLDLTNMAFEAGVKKGVNKLPQANTVG